MTIDEILARVRAHLELDAEQEHELLEEIRVHLEEAVERARARGLDEETALMRAAVRFGIEDVGRELQAAHTGWGAADGVIAAALPVVCTLMLRWLVFAPEGTAVGWREVLTQPAFWVVALAALLIPLLKFLAAGANFRPLKSVYLFSRRIEPFPLFGVWFFTLQRQAWQV